MTTLIEHEEKPGALRWILAGIGWVAFGLAVVGVFLPLLPTTPFLILAAACFVRSSPRLHARLLADPRVGPYLEQWQRDHSIPAGAKRRAYGLIVVTFAISIWLVDVVALRVMLALLGVGVIVFLACLKTGPEVD